MNRYTSLMLLALLVLLLGSLRGGHAQAADEQRILRKIEIRGFEHVSDAVQKDAQAQLKSKIGQPYSEEAARTDENAIFDLGWFFRVSHSVTPVADGVLLTITVVENPVITGVDFVGNTIFTTEKLRALLKTKPGQVLYHEQVHGDAQRVKDAYANDIRRFSLVEITDIKVVPNPKNAAEGRLVFYILEPKVGEIRVEGNTKTQDKVILRQLEFKVGDIYNEQSIRKSLLNLEHLGIFAEATAVPEPGPQPGTLIVAIHVKEGRTGSASIGFGHSSLEGLIGFVDISDSNIFGSGQRVSARVQVGTDSTSTTTGSGTSNSYELGYTNPWIDHHRTSMNVDLYNSDLLSQSIIGSNSFTYNERREGGRIAFSRPRGYWTNSIGLRDERMVGDNFEATLAAQYPTLQADLQTPANVQSISLSTARDTRNSLLNATTGSYLQLSSELAGKYIGLGSSASFAKLNVEGRRYWNLTRPKRSTTNTEKDSSDTSKVIGVKDRLPLVLASRLKLGSVIGSAPFLDQYRIGGADSLRGYTEDFFPGNQQLLMNNELRFPVNETIQLVSFVDFGDAWSGQFSSIAGDPDFKLHTGYGLGVRIQTPIGPLRLDYGLNGEGGHQFHFGMGSTF